MIVANRYKKLPIQMIAPILFLTVAGFLFIPDLFETRVQSQNEKSTTETADSAAELLGNFDIRTDRNAETIQNLLLFREEAGKTAADVADLRDGFVRAEERLRQGFPSLIVEYNSDLVIPEVISPDIRGGKYQRLTASSRNRRPDVLRSFAKDNKGLFGLTERQINGLTVGADYVNPPGNMAFACLNQTIAGIPVFRGEIKAGFTLDGRIIRIINNLAPGVNDESVSKEFGDPLDAVRSAAENISHKFEVPNLAINTAASSDKRIVFGLDDWATVAEKQYFPIEPGVVRPVWLVLIWRPADSFYVAVDASTGVVLWRKNITESQTQTSGFDVYSSPQAWIKSTDSPAPFTPGPADPTNGTQAPAVTRNFLTVIGNEAPDPGRNDLGWITDNTNISDGNNVEAGIDRDGINGVDAPQPGDGSCPGPGCRSFTSAWNPPPGNPGPGDAPLDPEAQRGAVIQYFYLLNRFHDVAYEVGFNEAAGNFQNDNFGRGGSGGDRLSAEAQDSSGTNGANAAFAGDGNRGRIQMFIWTGSDPNRDGAADSQIVIHEASHGISARLHGNGIGLSSNMSRGMGEGWSDFYAQAFLSESTDPASGVYATGGYVSYRILGAAYEANYYYGFRRFPLALLSFTGGPQDRPHNPLTFGNLNTGNCSTFDSAFPPGPVGSGACDQVHKSGEIWSSALWEVRAKMIERLGWEAGTRRTLQVVTDGMKLSPLNPTFLQGRDAIIAAASAIPDTAAALSDVEDVSEGFRIRGMGFSASIQSSNPAVVTEAFDSPYTNLSRADFDGDGRTDISAFRPSEGNWYILGSTDGFFAAHWGISGDVPAPGDFDGDGKSDIAIFRASDVPGENDWWILNSNGFTLSGASWGSTGDIPVVSDYDGDGRSDLTLWRNSTAVLYVLSSGPSGGTATGLGAPGDTPVAGDFDGDGTADPTTFNSGTWVSQLSGGGTETVNLGTAGDQPAAGDFDGDGETDQAIFRPSSGLWNIRNSASGSLTSVGFGAAGDIAVPGDYDGDGKDDLAVYRNGEWWINGSTSGGYVVTFGLATDLPVVRYANP